MSIELICNDFITNICRYTGGRVRVTMEMNNFNSSQRTRAEYSWGATSRAIKLVIFLFRHCHNILGEYVLYYPTTCFVKKKEKEKKKMEKKANLPTVEIILVLDYTIQSHSFCLWRFWWNVPRYLLQYHILFEPDVLMNYEMFSSIVDVLSTLTSIIGIIPSFNFTFLVFVTSVKSNLECIVVRFVN